MSKGTPEPGIYLRGAQYWIRFRYRGKEHREPAGTLAEARLRLARRRVDIGDHRFRPEADALSLATLLEAYQAHLVVKGSKATSRQTIASVARTLLRQLGAEAKAITIRPMVVDRYITDRLAAGLARGSVNTEINVLRAALRWAVETEQLPHVPRLSGPGGMTVRQGYVEPTDFIKIVTLLSPADADLAQFLYLTGRRYTEGAELTWPQIREDEVAWGILKNADGLTLPLFRALDVVLARRRAARRVGVLWVFHHEGRSLEATFRRHFERAATAAGFPDLVPHDMRRSALRNLRRAGVMEEVAMTISGHRDRDVFARYNITSTGDQRDAFGKLEAYLGAKFLRTIAHNRGVQAVKPRANRA